MYVEDISYREIVDRPTTSENRNQYVSGDWRARWGVPIICHSLLSPHDAFAAVRASPPRACLLGHSPLLVPSLLLLVPSLLLLVPSPPLPASLSLLKPCRSPPLVPSPPQLVFSPPLLVLLSQLEPCRSRLLVPSPPDQL